MKNNNKHIVRKYDPVFILVEDNKVLKREFRSLKKLEETARFDKKGRKALEERMVRMARLYKRNKKVMEENGKLTLFDEKEYVSGKISKDEYKSRLMSTQGLSYTGAWLKR